MFSNLIKKYSGLVEYLDVRVDNAKSEILILENSRIKSIINSESKGFGVRVFYNSCYGYAYSQDFTNAEKVFEKAVKLAVNGSKYVKEKFKLKEMPALETSKSMSYKTDPFSVDVDEKIRMLKELEKGLNHKLILNKTLSLQASRVSKEFYNSEGSSALKNEIVGRFIAQATGKKDNDLQNSFSIYSYNKGFEEKKFFSKTVSDAKAKLLRALNSKPIKPGTYKAVIDPELAGVFFHEAVGHACEADHHLMNASILKNKMNKMIASKAVNLYDDPRKNGYGNYAFDDEGIPAKRTDLIKGGFLVGLLHSRETASRMKTEPTGNGRAESTSFSPIPRMSNMCLEKGDYSFDEMIKSIKNGVYLKGFRGGEVSPLEGTFQFACDEGYYVKNGEIQGSVRGAGLIGETLKILKLISAVGRDVRRTKPGGYCGKGGQSVRVDELMPHLIIDKVMIGGVE